MAAGENLAGILGSLGKVDEAIQLQAGIEAFLQQNIPERADVQESLDQLAALFQQTAPKQ